MSEVGKRQAVFFHHDGIAKHPILVIVAMAMLAVLSVIYTVKTLRIDTSTTDMISAEVTFRQNETAFKRAFPAFNESIVAVIDSDSPEQSAQAAKALAEAMTADTDHFSRVDLPGDDPFFETHGLLYLDTDQLTTLGDRLASAQPLLAALTADPNLRGLADFVRLVLEEAGDQLGGDELERLFEEMAAVVAAATDDRPAVLSWQQLLDISGATSGKRRLLLAEPTLDHSSLAPAAGAISAVRTMADDLGITSENGLRMRLTGSAALDHEELETVSRGAVWAGLIATAGIAVLLAWGLGSIRLIVATLVTLLVGLVITAGFATLLVGQLNLISVTFAVLFVGLGVDFGIHLCLRYKEEIHLGSSHDDGLRKAIAGVGGPLTLSAICAGLGFIAFVPTDYQGLAELGIISATGMVVAWAVSLTLLPALLQLMPISDRHRNETAPMIQHRWTERYAHIILGLVLIGAISALPTLPRVGFDFNPLHLKDPESESVSTFLDLERNPDTAANSIDVLAADLAEADAIAERLHALPEVGTVITLSSFVPDEQEEKLDIIDEMAFFLGDLQPATTAALGTEERREAFESLTAALGQAELTDDGQAAELMRNLDLFVKGTGADDASILDLEQRLTRYLPDLLHQLDNALQPGRVDLDSLPPSLRAPWANEAGEARVLARPAIGTYDNRSLAKFADAVRKVVPDATGTPIIITEAGRVVVGSFIKASWIALLLISVVLIVVMRRITDVLLVLIPLALAIMFTGTTSVFMGLELNFANVIVLPLLLGLGVSGAIHVVMRQRAQSDPGSAQVNAGLASTSRAVLFSALTTVASFGSLAVSAHQGMASMGLLLTIAILWSLVCTLVILPALLALFGPGRNPLA